MIEVLKRNWEGLAKNDPLWAILSDPAKMGNKWDLEEFFATGVREVGLLADYIKALGVPHDCGRALDFGCGVGRLTQALAGSYSSVEGLDISAEMVRQAEEYNKCGGRVRYHVNDSKDLPFADDAFDLVYTNIVLQHIRKEYGLAYISEFIRVIKPGGLAIFQAPSKCLEGDGGCFVSPIATAGGTYDIEMNMFPKEEVLSAISRSGGKVVEIAENASAGPKFVSYRYCVTK